MYEPFPGNYVWNLSVNIAIGMGGAMGEMDRANGKVREIAKSRANMPIRAVIRPRSALKWNSIASLRAGGVEHCSADNMEANQSFIADWVADRFIGKMR